MNAGDRYQSKNRMFWRADTKLAELSRDQRWIDFHRACGRDGLFFDDIDPVNDDPKKDVTDRMRGRGYSAIAFRLDKDNLGFSIQRFVASGKGQDPVAAVLDTYRNAIAAGDPVTPGHEAIFDGPLRSVGTPVSSDVGEIDALIGPADDAAGINIEDLIG